MSKYDETFCTKKHKEVTAIIIMPTRYHKRTFNVSKVFWICGIFLLTFGYDFNWISSSSTLVAADKHTYGSIDANALDGLCLPRFFSFLFSFFCRLFFSLLLTLLIKREREFGSGFHIQFIKSKVFHINLKIKQ